MVPCTVYAEDVRELMDNGGFMQPDTGNEADASHMPIYSLKLADRASMLP